MREYQDRSGLIEALRNTEEQLALAENRLNNTTDELLTDSIIYEMAALYKRHAYYLRLCRELKVKAGERYAV